MFFYLYLIFNTNVFSKIIEQTVYVIFSVICYRFMLYLKLFIVMGVNWLAEIISWATDPDGSNYNIWYLTDIGNSLQGVLIFLIFVCKKRVLRLLNKKLCPRFELFKTSTISTRTTNSFTSRSSTKNKDVEMTPKNVQNSTINQLHDFKV